MNQEQFWELYRNGDMTIESIDTSVKPFDPLNPHSIIIDIDMVGKLIKPMECMSITVNLGDSFDINN